MGEIRPKCPLVCLDIYEGSYYPQTARHLGIQQLVHGNLQLARFLLVPFLHLLIPNTSQKSIHTVTISSLRGQDFGLGGCLQRKAASPEPKPSESEARRAAEGERSGVRKPHVCWNARCFLQNPAHSPVPKTSQLEKKRVSD